MIDDYAKEYLGTFPPPDKLLDDLAREYHERCEAYDRTVCTGPVGRDGILPGGPGEFALINKNAHGVLTELIRRGEEQGRKRNDIVQAIQKYDGRRSAHPTSGESK